MRLSLLVPLLLLGGIAAANASDPLDWRLMLTHPEDQFDQQADAANLLPPVVRTGTGQVAGMTGSAALYATVVGGPVRNAGSEGVIERAIPLEAWRGKRVRLTVRLKSVGAISANIEAAIARKTGTRSGSKLFSTRNVNGMTEDWQVCHSVRDVPADATAFMIDLHLYGKGTLWIDKVALEAAGDVAAPAGSSPLQGCVPGETTPIRNVMASGEIPLGGISIYAGR